MIKKTENGWLLDIRPNGTNGKRYRKTLPTKIDAVRWEAYIRKNKTDSKDWEPKRSDQRKLSDLIELWHSSHRINLKEGKARLKSLMRTCKGLGNPSIDKFTATQWTQYRKKRLEVDQVNVTTVNHEHAYLNAVFNELIRIDELQENPIQKVRKLKTDEKELSFLSQPEQQELLATLKKHNYDTYCISLICLSTGARWSEAEGLESHHLFKRESDYLITYTGTKNSKNLSVPIKKSVVDQFRRNTGQLFPASYRQFRYICETKLSFQLPEQQMSHILRHTFASYFMMNGGNILVLQKILGHHSLDMTMRYAHLAPEHLEEAIKFNPLNGHSTGFQKI